MLRAGWAEKDITPLTGIPLGGYFTPRWADKILDPLRVTVLYLSSKELDIALVSLDLLALRIDTVKEWKREISKNTGIPEECIFLHTVHTHSSPLMEEVYDQKPDWGYRELVKKKIIEALREAQWREGEVEVRVEKSRIRGITFNRRYRMKNGKVLTNPPRNHPDIVGPAGPVDEEMLLLKFSQDRENTLFMVNFALHVDTVDQNYISADFVGVLRDVLKKVYGEKSCLLFLQGASGDLNHINLKSEIPTYHPSHRWRIGRVLAGEVMKLAELSSPLSFTSLRISSEEIEIGLRKPTSEEIEEAKKLLKEKGLKEGEYSLPLTSEDLARDEEKVKILFARELIKLSDTRKDRENIEIHGIKLGEVVFIGIPGEVFTEIGIKIKEISPSPYTAITGLFNGSIGYIPTRKAFQEGGYEILPTRYGRIGEDAEEKIIKTAQRIIEKLK